MKKHASDIENLAHLIEAAYGKPLKDILFQIHGLGGVSSYAERNELPPYLAA